MGPEYKYKIFLEADIVPKKATIASRKEAASVLGIPPEEERQADLTYFTSVFVSSGENLNKAYFFPSEILMADKTIPTKAVDIEHKEDQIIGHIYKHAYMDDEHKELDPEDMKSMSIEDLDEMSVHVEIASVVYRTRFPQIASEIEEKKWKVSMEAYYMDFDVKIGSMILTKAEAMSLGLDVTKDETFYNTTVKIIDGDKLVAEGSPSRVLRGIHFSGVGIVENPANPPSVILETSSTKNTITLDMSKLQTAKNNVTSMNIENFSSASSDKVEVIDTAALEGKDTVGICVSYKKEVLSSEPKNQDTTVLHEDWCTLFDTTCTAFGHDATDQACLRYKAQVVAGVMASMYEPPVSDTRRRLDKLISKINKFCKK